MASICLKNSIDKYWRRNAPNSIKDDERTLLKSQLTEQFNEPDLKIARQLAVIIGKLARFELPNNWPELMNRIMQIIQETLKLSAVSNEATQLEVDLVHNRCLMILHQIIKALASKRLANDRKVFEELSSNIIGLINQLGFSYIQKCLLSPICDQDANLDETKLAKHLFDLDQSIICLKILHKLMLHGFKDNVENALLSQFIENLMQTFDQQLAKYNKLRSNQNQTLSEYFGEKYQYVVALYVDIISEYQETYPINFIQTCMSQCFNLIIQVCFTLNGKSFAFEKLCISLMNLMKSIIMCDKYKQSLVKIDNEGIRQKQQQAIEIKQTYLTKENLQIILDFLFNHYLLMTRDELDIWNDSAEEFVNEDGTATDAWKYNIRASAETLFQAFVHEYNGLVVPIVVELIKSYSNASAIAGKTQVNSDSFDADQVEAHTLLKEASYNCGCIAAWELVSQIDFDAWLSQSLLPEIKSNCHVLIKRRILLLISNWVSIKLSPENRLAVYELLCQCLQLNENMVVRIQAALTLKAVMDDVHFEKDAYLPYMNYHFGLLCQLLKQVEECETKIKVLNVLSFLIERVDIHIRPYAAQLADYLPFLWQESVNFNMLRCCILATFYHLVKSFGSHSTSYHAFLIPVIHFSTDSTNPASVYLLENGLELWNITLQNSTIMTPDLLKLFTNLVNLLDRDSTIWKLCLDIIDSYVVLDGRQLLQVIYSSFFFLFKF
jgi:hypothetical protein